METSEWSKEFLEAKKTYHQGVQAAKTDLPQDIKSTIKELRLEIAHRDTVYPELIAGGKLTLFLAMRRTTRLYHAMAMLEELEKFRQPKLWEGP